MTMTDPVADMLTRLRNALAVKKRHVDVPASKLKASIAEVLQREGYIGAFEVLADGRFGMLRIQLRYDEDGKPVIRKLQRESRPGRRVYCGMRAMPRVVGGLGVAVLSTPQGVLSDREARERRVGGEYLCSVF